MFETPASLRHYRRRLWTNRFMMILLALSAAIAVLPLLCVFGYVLANGLPALSWDFFTQLPKPVGEPKSGLANALVGSSVLLVLSTLLGVPWGIGVGIYLSEFAPHAKRGKVVRFAADLLASIPSIVVGLFVFALVVRPLKSFSALAGGLALAILMIPTVARSTEEILRLVPNSLREAGFALGAPRWRVIWDLVVIGSLRGVMTGVLMSMARVCGETAPLLFTAFGNRFWPRGLLEPIASVPVQIYNYAISPFEEWHAHAWAGALILIGCVFGSNLLLRWVLRTR